MESGKPLEFIQCKNDKFIVNKEALKMLQEIKNPICVISIAGLARTGKSVNF
jgi:hypothetical protein